MLSLSRRGDCRASAEWLLCVRHAVLDFQADAGMHQAAGVNSADLLPGEGSEEGEGALLTPLLQLYAVQVVLVRVAAAKVQNALPQLHV